MGYLEEQGVEFYITGEEFEPVTETVVGLFSKLAKVFGETLEVDILVNESVTGLTPLNVRARGYLAFKKEDSEGRDIFYFKETNGSNLVYSLKRNEQEEE